MGMHRKIAIVQSNYIPWKGYFDMINMVDEFVLYDTAQYTRRDWRNRNKIKSPQGPMWLSIPVDVKGKYFQKIKDTRISDKNWNLKHWQSIRHSYAKSKCFSEYKDFLEELYLTPGEDFLSDVNHRFLSALCKEMGIQTRIRCSSEFELPEDKTEKLIAICRQCEAHEYLSGPAAKDYLDEALFNSQNIKVAWMDYSDYPEYEQLYPPFDHAVSIIDLLCNTGKDFFRYMKSF
jgi:hypothetical protein